MGHARDGREETTDGAAEETRTLRGQGAQIQPRDRREDVRDVFCQEMKEEGCQALVESGAKRNVPTEPRDKKRTTRSPRRVAAVDVQHVRKAILERSPDVVIVREEIVQPVRGETTED